MRKQYGITFGLVALSTLIGVIIRSWVDYHTIGFVYLFPVLLASAFFQRGAIFTSAILSALAWNFFFITPEYSFVIGTSQDLLLCCTYFLVAMLGGYFNIRARKNEKLLMMKEESERLHQTLINTISHEMRTPLTVIAGNSMALLESSQIKNDEWMKTTALELNRASERLNGMVENLLDMSRIESGHLRLKKEVFSVGELIEYSLKHLEPYLKEHQIRIVQNESDGLDDLILGDFKFLDHVMSNLFLNAVRYSPVGSMITIEVKHAHGKVQVSIEDQGSGIKKEYHEKIFEKFYRIPGTPTGGIGLGLSIVKAILDAHGAKISVIQKNSGACFEMIFDQAIIPEGIRGDF